LFEDTVKTILTTNTSWSGTIRMTESLVTQFGDPLPGHDDQFSFPNPDRIASSNEQTLRNETRLGYRAPYILDLARQIASGALDIEELKSSKLPSDELHKELTTIKGVGDYAAANLMMLLGRYGNLPIDSWALKMVSQEFFNGDPISPDQVREVFDPWGEWKGLAYWLWDWSEA
jgi:3-methyladenine DNA glycosylase/8-oxoguanine DNA glycosylase